MKVLFTQLDWQPISWEQAESRIFGRRLELLRQEQDRVEGPCDPRWYCIHITHITKTERSEDGT